MILDFDYYTKKYHGILVDEVSFPRFELQASQFIRYYTQHRVMSAIDGRFSDDIKITVCKVIELYYELDKAKNDLKKGYEISRKGIASETVPDHSISFKQISEDELLKLESTYEKRIISAIRQGLMWTGLLYRGL